MKTKRILTRWLLAVTAAGWCGVLTAGAWELRLDAPGVPSDPVAAIRLPKPAQDALRLSRAQVSNETIVVFIQNSPTFARLSAREILFLRQEGVADSVLTALVNQGTNPAPVAAEPAPAPAPPAPPAPAAPVYVTAAPEPWYALPLVSVSLGLGAYLGSYYGGYHGGHCGGYYGGYGGYHGGYHGGGYHH